jgi:hypothetical protein
MTENSPHLCGIEVKENTSTGVRSLLMFAGAL